MARKAAGAEGGDDGFECNNPSRLLIEGKRDDMSVWHEAISDMKGFFANASSRLTAKSNNNDAEDAGLGNNNTGITPGYARLRATASL